MVLEIRIVAILGGWGQWFEASMRELSGCAHFVKILWTIYTISVYSYMFLYVCCNALFYLCVIGQ